ncbi:MULTISPECIES: response regulator transcription factor [Psychrobacter]|mgnify:FL=1|uniref:Two-component system regulatory protein n=1 Tax=Psychrobacter alimentarius TaxID=261164 RepID=A0ABM5ZWJ7_9GAMM|nr:MULTISPECIES: response regulator transcription factor [Psychrobacter]AMT96392.1 Two-component system regulatory protein [Psychrobacter alimentarius]PAT64187.1 DNA-binding response regulator [Psychrobacter sp. JB193]QCB31215.1 response regulator transcription factor [Psychrobacter sp. PAMC27889]
MYKILVIEDNPDIVANIYAFFEPKGFELDNAHNGYSGLTLASNNRYDVILLDVMLPGMNGTQLCKKLREELHDKTPVLMLTARDTILDKVAGFDSGADDYLVKPFSLVELESRIKALIRRHQDSHCEQSLNVGGLCLNIEEHTVVREGKSLKLTPTGFKILQILMSASPRMVSKNELEEKVWADDIPSSDALRTHVHSVRAQVDKPFAKPMVMTVSGVGYQLIDPDKA